MAKINFTPAQKSAIQEKGANILVSASAGSGKTRVLVERVLHHLQTGIEIDRMLIVTFTDAAAVEMRERIQGALQKEIATASSAKKQWFVTQLTKLNTANISTLHAFCLHLIQRYYYLIGLDPVFRLLSDETERELLREDVWGTVREEFYSQNDPVFEQLTQNFSNDRSDEGLTALVFRTFDFSNAKAAPSKWLKQLAVDYQTEGALTTGELYQKKLLPVFKEQLEQAVAELQTAQEIVTQAALPKFTEILEADQKQLGQLQSQLTTSSWNTLRAAFQGFTFKRAPVLRKLEPVQKAAKDEVLAQRQHAKNIVSELSERYFLLEEEQLKAILLDSKKLIAKLGQVVHTFARAFAAEKKQRHLLDFNDLEHLALKILQTNTQEARQVRADLQQKFSEILVDEYQDTNQLQETLLQLLTKPDKGNLFMVGDVKQSIYGFRLADPALFLQKYHAYAHDDSQGKRIVLAENFRSVKDVTAFTNLIFMQLMDKQVGGLDYDQNAQLRYGATYYPELNTTTQILLYESGTQEKTTTHELEPFDEHFVAESAAAGQIRLTAQQIKQLLAQKRTIYDRQQGQERLMQYSDIVLLVPTRNNNLLIMSEFQQAGIPIDVKDAQNYFQTTEIQIMLSFLKIIDNPYQDIPLVSVLRSPIVGLKENALAYLRINEKTGDYYQAVKHFWLNFDPQKEGPFGHAVYEKISRFLEMLTELRKLAHQNQLADLIWKIYDDTGFLDYVGGMPGGAQRQANLHALYERASAYEKMSFRGLFQFIRFIDKLQKREKDLAAANSKVTQNAVQVMTIHGSKGLEFPVVFLLDTTHQFNERALREDYLLDDTEGIGITWLSPTERVKVETLPKLVINERQQRKNAAEQMRLLYVALTRAEQQLYLVGAYQSRDEALSKWQKAFQSSTVTLNSSLRQGAKSFMDWIGMCLIRRQQSLEQFSLTQKAVPALEKNAARFKISFVAADELQSTSQAADHDWFKKLAQKQEPVLSAQANATFEKAKQLLEYNYPQLELTRTTAYQSVSDIKQLFGDPDEDQLQHLDDFGALQTPTRGHRIVQREFALPEFMEQKETVTSAQVGTATHELLRRVALEHAPTAAELKKLLRQLVTQGNITKSVAQKVNLQNVQHFFTTTLGQLLLQPQTVVKREVPFAALISAEQLFPVTATKDAILLHGIIDGYARTPTEIVVFDYKTDFLQAGDETKKAALVKRYRGQLNLYALALESILGQRVTKRYLYLLATGETVAL